jgi:cysteinyl-tRNA synthetase
MLRIFNTYGKKMETFRPVRKDLVTIFTCGPSVYQRSHIGNFRTFLFEDILVRYLEYTGHKVRRGMNFTDIEDKAIEEASKKSMTVRSLTGENIRRFVREMALLRIKTPDYLPRASESVKEAADIIEKLLDLGIAYRYQGDIYFDPLKVRGFGKLYGLDMNQWPKEKRRFHKDTYPGMRWNLGDFILWHGHKKGDKDYWDTKIGRGRPSWNIQDPAMVSKHFNETLSAYCGGIDNLFRHHDYNLAVLEAVRSFPMARFWLHCQHLYVKGQKMSKSKGNIHYTDTIMNKGYGADELRFFLIYGHYREILDYSDEAMAAAAERLTGFKRNVARIKARAGKVAADGKTAERIMNIFVREMDDDLNVKKAFEGVNEMLLSGDVKKLNPAAASGIINALKEIDKVLKVIF